METKLIELYCLICRIYDSQSSLKSQRLSNFKPRFSDQELITVYLFGHLNGLYQKKAIYHFTRNYWATWFPNLPSYQAFNRRVNLLESAFHLIGATLLDTFANSQTAELDHLIDSMPVMLASGSFSRRARVARDVANVGYCAAKRLHFHGVPLHLIASRRAGRLPLPKKSLAQRSLGSRPNKYQRAADSSAQRNAVRRQGVLRCGFENSIKRAEHQTFCASEETQRQRVELF